MQLGKATREAYGEELAVLGAEMPELVVLDADLSKSTMSKKFADVYPDRFFNTGICEANMVGIAAGLASCGKVPFASSFSVFLVCKGFDQMRMSVAYANTNVKLCGSHAGISVGEDGVSQMAVEDLALVGALNGMVIIVPADEHEMRAAVRAVARHVGPVFLRSGRPKAPIIYPDGCPHFHIGKADKLHEGRDLTIITYGLMVAKSLDAANLLAKSGISARVLNMSTIKPLDKSAIIQAGGDTGAFVVVEEHLSHGGLGQAVAQMIAATRPVPMEFVNLGNRYAESGPPEALLEKYGLTARSIATAARRVLSRK